MNRDDIQLLMFPIDCQESRHQARTCAMQLSRKQRILSSFSLIFVCTCVVSSCTSTLRRPEPTTSYIPISEIRTAQGGSQIYNLSKHKRLMCERRASEGDIVAAKTLLEYHEMVTKDEKQYQRWSRVVARLEKAQRRREKRLP
jgi:hypothetical protein